MDNLLKIILLLFSHNMFTYFNPEKMLIFCDTPNLTDKIPLISKFIKIAIISEIKLI